LVGSRSAQRYLVFKHSHDHPEISSVSLTKSASSTWLIARVLYHSQWLWRTIWYQDPWAARRTWPAA